MHQHATRRAIYTDLNGDQNWVFFHRWVTVISAGDGQSQAVYALIENEAGEIEQVKAEKIQFENHPGEEKQTALRPVSYKVGYNGDEEDGYFHKWITKVYGDQPGLEHLYGVIEAEDGGLSLMEIEVFRFTDK